MLARVREQAVFLTVSALTVAPSDVQGSAPGSEVQAAKPA